MAIFDQLSTKTVITNRLTKRSSENVAFNAVVQEVIALNMLQLDATSGVNDWPNSLSNDVNPIAKVYTLEILTEYNRHVTEYIYEHIGCMLTRRINIGRRYVT